MLQVKEKKKKNICPKSMWQPAESCLGNMQSVIQQVNHPICSRIGKKSKTTNNLDWKNSPSLTLGVTLEV